VSFTVRSLLHLKPTPERSSHRARPEQSRSFGVALDLALRGESKSAFSDGVRRRFLDAAPRLAEDAQRAVTFAPTGRRCLRRTNQTMKGSEQGVADTSMYEIL
jgi:hypothetical protein